MSYPRILLTQVIRNPDDEFMVDLARYLTDPIFGCLGGVKVLICDRDGRFSPAFRSILEAAGVRVVRIPRRAPNCNAYAERFVRSIKEECLHRMIFFSQASLQRAVQEFIAHYHRERNHQGIDNRLIEQSLLADRGPVECRERLGGMLRYYHRAA